MVTSNAEAKLALLLSYYFDAETLTSPPFNPDFCRAQVLPTSVVLIITPFLSPTRPDPSTARAVFESSKQIPRKSASVPEDCFDQVAPPSAVLRIRPPSPTAHAVFASMATTSGSHRSH